MIELVGITAGVVFSIVGYLLSRKDSQQEEFIKDLYTKHQSDADKLAALELLVARDYNNKAEIDALFNMMRKALAEGFERVEKAISEIKQGHKGQ